MSLTLIPENSLSNDGSCFIS